MNKLKKKGKNNYHQEYYQRNKTEFRKYVFCTLCGRENKNPRYVKVCSPTCSKSLRKITVLGTVREYLRRKKITSSLPSPNYSSFQTQR